MKKITILLILMNALVGSSYAQNVGIGVPSPAYPLTVLGNSLGKSISAIKDTVEVGFYNDGATAYIQTWTAHNLYFATNNGSAKITLSNNNGYVGIGNLAGGPTAQLDVNGTFRLRGNGAAAGAVLTSDANGNATWQAPVAPTTNNIYSIGAFEFRPFNSADFVNIGGGQGGAYFNNATTNRLIAPVHLPTGAKVTKIVYGFLDNTAQDFDIEFGSENIDQSGYSSSYNINTSGASASWRTITYTPASPITINNTVDAYYISAYTSWPGNTTMAIKGAAIYYTY